MMTAAARIMSDPPWKLSWTQNQKNDWATNPARFWGNAIPSWTPHDWNLKGAWLFCTFSGENSNQTDAWLCTTPFRVELRWNDDQIYSPPVKNDNKSDNMKHSFFRIMQQYITHWLAHDALHRRSLDPYKNHPFPNWGPLPWFVQIHLCIDCVESYRPAISDELISIMTGFAMPRVSGFIIQIFNHQHGAEDYCSTLSPSHPELAGVYNKPCKYKIASASPASSEYVVK